MRRVQVLASPLRVHRPNWDIRCEFLGLVSPFVTTLLSITIDNYHLSTNYSDLSIDLIELIESHTALINVATFLMSSPLHTPPSALNRSHSLIFCAMPSKIP
jgi:hypothetical protein